MPSVALQPTCDIIRFMWILMNIHFKRILDCWSILFLRSAGIFTSLQTQIAQYFYFVTFCVQSVPSITMKEDFENSQQERGVLNTALWALGDYPLKDKIRRERKGADFDDMSVFIMISVSKICPLRTL